MITTYLKDLNTASEEIVQASKNLHEEQFKELIATQEHIPILWESLKSDSFENKKRWIVGERITALVSESLCEHSLNEERLLSQVDFYLMYLNSYIGYGYSTSVIYEKIYHWFDLYLKMVKDISWLEDRREKAAVHKDLLALWESVMKREWIRLIREYESSDSEEEENQWLAQWVKEPWRIPQFLVDSLANHD